jgi:hypothetical protein
MFDASTKKSVKKGRKCKYTFFIENVWQNFITIFNKTAKCTGTYPDVNYLQRGKVENGKWKWKISQTITQYH